MVVGCLQYTNSPRQMTKNLHTYGGGHIKICIRSSRHDAAKWQLRATNLSGMYEVGHLCL